MIKQRIATLRALFKDNNIQGYIIPSFDEYLSEYTAAYAKRLEYLTGFTGSNGMAIILEHQAFFFTDGRYLEQASKELDLEIFQISDLKDLKKVLDNYQEITLGYDPRLFTSKSLNHFASYNLELINSNLIDQIWLNKPAKPASDVYIYPLEFAGMDYKDKLSICREYLRQNQAKYLVLTDTSSICWLFNLRANDIDFCPVLLGYSIIMEKEAYLFTNIERISRGVKEQRSDITFYPEEELDNFLSNLEDKILIDQAYANCFIVSLIKNKQNISDPCILPRACKNEAEIHNFIQAHIYDAVAICEFLSEISYIDLTNLTEYDLGEQLTALRRKQPSYIMDSFATICGFRENGSIIHYHATKDMAKKIEGSGLLLIDSGAHYMGATTDITRVISIGRPTDEQKRYYTKVLKGHIALATIKFPKGTSGSNIDALARQFLWEEGENYAHGTGHGVGNALSVHEGPQTINSRNNVPLQAGMILSNEPGFYKQGEYGIRIENLMYVKTSNYEGYLEFKNLTLVPYAKELIDFDLLTKAEIKYIKDYYQAIFNKVYPLLSATAQEWLKEIQV